MKMIKIVSVITLIIVMNMLMGCSSNEKVYFFSDKLYYNHEGFEDKVTLNVNYAYSGKSPKIELVELKGEGLEKVSSVLGDISEAIFVDNLYNGYHVGTFYIDIDVSNLSDEESISVSDIIIKCNGENREIDLLEKVSFKKNDFEETCYRLPLQPLQCAAGMPTSDVKYPVFYVFEVNEQFTLTDITTNGLIDIEEVLVFVNDVEQGSKNEVLPLVLDKNDTLKLEVKFAIDEGKENANINTDVIISGVNSEGELTERYFGLFMSGLFDEIDAKKLTETIKE